MARKSYNQRVKETAFDPAAHTAEAREVWSESAERYEKLSNSLFAKTAEEFVEFAGLRKKWRVLDVACGPGIATRAAAARIDEKGSVLGVDLAPGMLARAKAVPAAKRCAPIEYAEMDVHDLQLETGSFDAAISQLGLMLFAQPDKALILDVVDATNLERNLYYTLELASLCTPMVILLNKWDIARRRGVEIDPEALGRQLGVRVVPFVATTGEGLSGLKTAVEDFNAGRLPAPGCHPTDPDEKWKLIGRISAECQKITHKHATLLEKLEDITSRPGTGLPFAAAVMLAVFWLIRFVGEGLISHVLDPLFQAAWMPLVTAALGGLQDGGFLNVLLLGTTPAPMESFGLLTTGLYIPFVTVLPYIVSFYAALGLLEDIGYLPRLAVMLDSSMHRLGLHGYGTIPLMLGMGCKVPAILAARVLETPRERVIATALTLGLAPCMPQTAMILSLLAPFHIKYTLAVFGAIAAAGIVSSLLLSRLLKGETPELFLEIPPYQAPCCPMLARKLYFRVKDFLFEAVPMIIVGVLLVALLDVSGLLAGISEFFKPAVTVQYPDEKLVPYPAFRGALLFLEDPATMDRLAPGICHGCNVSECPHYAAFSRRGDRRRR